MIEYFDFVVSEKSGMPQFIFKGGDETLFTQKLGVIQSLYDTMTIIPQTDNDDDDSYVYRYGKRIDQKEYNLVRLS